MRTFETTKEIRLPGNIILSQEQLKKLPYLALCSSFSAQEAGKRGAEDDESMSADFATKLFTNSVK